MLGEVLKQAREEKNMTQKDVAENTNLLVQIVDDLEKDDFHRIAAAIYGKGFVRLYAECVGLPQEQIKLLIREFTMLYDGAKPSQVQTKPVPLPKSAPKPTLPSHPAPAVRTVQPPAPAVATRPVVIEPPPKREPTPVPTVRTNPQPRVVVTPPKPIAPIAVELPPGPPSVSEEPARPVVRPVPAAPIVETPVEPEPEPEPVVQTASGPEAEPFVSVESPEVPTPVPPPVEEKPIEEEKPIAEEAVFKPTPVEEPVEEKAESVPIAPVPEVRKPAPAPVIEEPPEPVKPDLSKPVVEMEETEPPVDEDDLFSMARRIVSIRQGGAAEIPDDPETVPEVRKPATEFSSEKPEKKPANSKTPFSVVFKQAVQISMEKISKTAQSSVEVSQRSFAPIKRLFSTKQAWLYTGAGLLVAILLVVGIRMIFRVTDHQTTIREGAANFPPPPMYVE